ncbi:MAG: PKD domain-containing protein [Flavobacteriales bacterium]|nr:PKD domain-containing protein [Flavobacteriales bacterium]
MRLEKAYLLFLFLMLLGWKQSFAQYQINGNAAQTSCNCWRLTPAANGQNGSVWNVNLYDLSTPFNFTFDVFLGCNDGGADGIAFVLQPLSVNAGSSGGGIGYAGINPSLAVELDTYQNGGEPSYDHMAIQRNGDVSHTGGNMLAGTVPISASSNNVEDCAWHQLNVVWDPTTNTMTVYFDGVLRLSYTGDIINNIFGGNPNVYWGFTAATGGANNEHQFCNALDPAFIITSPVQCTGFPVDFQSSSAVATGQITDFTWDFGDGSTGSGGQISHTFTAPGTYTVTLTISSEGCTQSSNTDVTINPLPNFSLGTDQSICDGDSYQISPTGLSGGEQLTWSPTTGLDNPGVSNPTATPTTTTTYTLGVLDANGCPTSDDIQITVNPLPVADAGADQTICDGDVTNMAASGGVQYDWTPTTDLADATSATTQASPTATTNYSLTVTDANGCQDADDMTITVNPLPVVDAGADYSMCDQQTVQLQASGATNYSWSPTTGLSDAAIANPVFDGSTTTTFTVTGTDANGCQNTDDVTVTVFPLPVADFAQPAAVCLGQPTVFTDNSSGTGLTYTWDFGDNSPTDNTQSPSHTYATDGTFNVSLALVDGNGCTASASSTAEVHPLPVPAMNITDGQEFCEDDLIQFHNQSTGNITNVFWDFGDNAFLPAYPNHTSNLDDPTFAYHNFAFSPYTVRLGVEDAAGCYDQTQVVIIVHDRPEADFTSTNACEGQMTQFTDLSTVNSSTINGWSWDFGDASGTSALQNPTYLYATAGTYQAELTVTSTDGCKDTITNEVLVNPTPVVSLAGIDTCLNDETSFVNTTAPQDSTISNWDWDFGDGNTTTGITATHTYSDHGTFTVTLTATSDSGCAASGTTQVTVFPNPEPAFQAIEPEGCTPLDVLFVNQSTIATGYIASYEWSLGDSIVSTDMSPTNVYPDSGYYDITLVATSTEGCTTTLTVNNAIRANITPVADFTVDEPVVSLLDAQLELSDQSQHALTWDWNLGDGTTSTVEIPTHRYNDPGTYNLTLRVTNGDCEDVAYGTIKVEPLFTFYIPNTFTPNADGNNDTFYGDGEGIKTYSVRITDRWGSLIFESNDKDFHWDGTFKGKQVEIGVYIYDFTIVDVYGETHFYRGGVKLMR